MAKKKKNIKRTLLQILGVLFALGTLLIVAGMLLFLYYAYNAPKFNEAALRDQLPTKIYDKDDNLVTVLYMGQKRERVKFEDIPDTMRDAVLATEDNRFYEHGALDFKRLTGAVFKNFTGGFGSQGASTLTQQVVKRSFLTDQKSIERKAQEAYLSYRLEQEYDKNQIFEMYMNKIYYSDGIYGVKTAARYYFNKDLNQLSLAESAYLAGLPQVPNTYNIYDHPEAAEKRKDTVLYLMNRHNRISKAEMEQAQAEDLTKNLVPRNAVQRQNIEENDPIYASYVNVIKQELKNNKEFEGKSLSDVLTSGLKIYTNMDNNAQTSLQNNVDNMNIYKNKYQQAASTIVDTQTGALIAISGGRNFKDVVDRNLATDIHPVGSTIKPFLSYGPIIENAKWPTSQRIQDESEYDIHGIKFKNYDTQNHGVVTMRDAIRKSYNIPALKIFQEVNNIAGYDASYQFAKNVGLKYPTNDLGPSEALGGSSSEFSPTQMASAFSSFGNGGTYNKAHAIRKVVTQDDETIKFDTVSDKAMEDYTAYMVTDMLKGTFEPYGTAYGSSIPGVNLAAKTGTGTYGDEVYAKYNLPDNAAKDVWIVGYSPRYTMSVWMGFTKMAEGGANSFVGSEEQSLPKFLFKQVMSEISPADGQDFPMPNSVERNGIYLKVKGQSDNNSILSSNGLKTSSIPFTPSNSEQSARVSNTRAAVTYKQPTTEEVATSERAQPKEIKKKSVTTESPRTTEPTTTQPKTTQPAPVPKTREPVTAQPATAQPAQRSVQKSIEKPAQSAAQ
ncbi:transglycosylase domain-containing protein [Macrococcoides caseolyticum]|uniref:transglycosylase domain-containing protein n=1 Tax=Macrococcoides caseolyticum TaxID=69966 RepID=UPI001F3E66FC|nr:transglycosylase domain-containing protein [Macrococcus caseolyticus]MCE4957046.1 penicillin-binding protein [Macrococcus caseolyticus]